MIACGLVPNSYNVGFKAGKKVLVVLSEDKLFGGYSITESTKRKILGKMLYAYEYISQELLDRPKAGFSIPLDKWMRGTLKERLMDWTSRDYLIKQGIFNPDKTKNFYRKLHGKW